MGRTFKFTCNKCGFHVAVSGGTDRGLYVFTRTIECLDCHSLYDVAVRTRNAIPRTRNLLGFSRMLNRHTKSRKARSSGILRRPRAPGEMLQTGFASLSAWQDVPLKCPVNPRHRIQPWTKPGRCPVCGEHLEQNPFPYRIWD